MVASAVELVLEGLHLSKRLNKDAGREPCRPFMTRIVVAITRAARSQLIAGSCSS